MCVCYYSTQHRIKVELYFLLFDVRIFPFLLLLILFFAQNIIDIGVPIINLAKYIEISFFPIDCTIYFMAFGVIVRILFSY